MVLKNDIVYMLESTTLVYKNVITNSKRYAIILSDIRIYGGEDLDEVIA